MSAVAPVERVAPLPHHLRLATGNPEGRTAPSGAEAADGLDALLVEMSGELLGAPFEAMDALFTRALTRLVAFLGVERASIALPDPITGKPCVTHSAARSGVRPAPIGLSESELPWVSRQLRLQREPVALSAETRAYPEAGVDLATVRAHGMASVLFLPVTAGTRLLGVLSLGSAQVDRLWLPALVARLRLVGGILAWAFLRLDHERRLKKSLGEADALRERLEAEHEYLRAGPLLAEGFDGIVGESAALATVLFMAEQVAPMNTAVLLLGETGTGKELIAQAIHAKSHRRDRPLVKVNCAALPPTLIESELFGHEKGAFTGAVARRMGRFELADHGTLFLDEVGELPLPLQAKLLRVLQEGEFERLGSTVTRTVDVRVIAASNRDLSAAAREDTFRSDLYYRLAVFPIQVPPLRARRQDIPLLVWHILGQLVGALGRKIDRVPAAAMERLVSYAWPGNIRELRNVLERAVILSPGSTLLVDDLGEERPLPPGAAGDDGRIPTLVDLERAHIARVLELCQGRVRGSGNAAEQLGINASTLYSRMKKLGIPRATSPSESLSGGPARPAMT